MRIIPTKRYTRELDKFLKKHPEYSLIVNRLLKLFIQDPKHPTLRLHKLTNREHEYALSVDHSIRIICSVQDTICFLLQIGSHDEVY